MGRIHRYRTALSRHHRSRGFGIHSPFAFKFVLRVLGERTPYYAYEYLHDVREAVKSLKTPRDNRVISYKNSKMLFRIVNYFNPQHILQIGTTYGLSTVSMMAVSSKSRLWLYEPYLERFPAIGQVLQPMLDNIESYNDLSVAIGEYSAAVPQGEWPFVLVNSLPTDTDADLLTPYLTQILKGGAVVVMRNLSRSKALMQLWSELTASMEHGMTFTNLQMGIIVANPKLPHQDFELWF